MSIAGGGGSGGSSGSSLLKRARGRSLTKLAKQGIGAWILAVSTSVIAGIQSLTNLLLLTPVSIGRSILKSSAAAFILEPLGIVTAGANTSESAVANFGILGLIVAVVLVLAAFLIVSRFRSEQETSNFLPGFFGDLPFVGADEEAQADE